ncbi:hypothetical protein BDA99DRAFT_536706 [Phascolomyces articulosus]|uniref:Uncharacterized protein n=1 Tax=Phascolomyces articulosus TaxID=60185 RepID=A0AAD5PEP9_9FUNG|nr:hypothetical protein BDA99DRAFT_536706 [Phascolomyces articulosus]
MTPAIATSQCQACTFSELYTHFISTQMDLALFQNASDQGKKAYGIHDYTPAIEFHTKVLNTSHYYPQSFVLSHLAVTHEKFQQYQKVFDDCTQVELNDRKQLLPCLDTYWMRTSILLRQRNSSANGTKILSSEDEENLRH